MFLSRARDQKTVSGGGRGGLRVRHARTERKSTGDTKTQQWTRTRLVVCHGHQDSFLVGRNDALPNLKANIDRVYSIRTCVVVLS